jgi:hypothetical protein
VNPIDWVGWHRAYDDPDSWLKQRLGVVQSAISDFFASRADGPVRVVSICAGQGYDLLGVLGSGGHTPSVQARLVEIDPENVRRGRKRAAELRIKGVKFVCRDAGITDAYVGAVPADLVLVCGVLGRISRADVKNTIGLLPQICATSGRVIWTRHRRHPDLTPSIRAWFSESGFAERSFVSPGAGRFAVGVHELEADARPLAPGLRLFTYSG